MGRPASDKRDRLIDAAVTCFHARDISSTSLSDVSRAAGVPTGNVFYYFRTKDALVDAVIDHWRDWVEGDLLILAAILDPWQRLRTFVARIDERRANYTAFGCPLAGLSRGARLTGSPRAAAAAQPLKLQHAWLMAQFIEAGRSPVNAEADADFLLASLQGSFTLAHVSGRSSAISHNVGRLVGWLSTIESETRH